MTKPKRVRVRVPYPEREEVIERWCSCVWVHHEDEDGFVISRIHYADPACKLHAPGHDLPESI